MSDNIFYYTDKIETPDSTAVDTLWYSSVRRELFVKFKSGNIAGYRQFDPQHWQAIRDAHANGTSIGSIVARQIKGRFPGVSGDINPVYYYQNDPQDAKVETVPNINAYSVTVSVHREVTYAVTGSDDGEALSKALFQAQSAFKDADSIKPRAVTRVFG